MQPVVGSINMTRLEEISKAADITLSKEDWYDIYLTAGYKLP
jgi:predicted oxidoreductase